MSLRRVSEETGCAKQPVGERRNPPAGLPRTCVPDGGALPKRPPKVPPRKEGQAGRRHRKESRRVALTPRTQPFSAPAGLRLHLPPLDVSIKRPKFHWKPPPPQQKRREAQKQPRKESTGCGSPKQVPLHARLAPGHAARLCNSLLREGRRGGRREGRGMPGMALWHPTPSPFLLCLLTPVSGSFAGGGLFLLDSQG